MSEIDYKKRERNLRGMVRLLTGLIKIKDERIAKLRRQNHALIDGKGSEK
ncbi:hypothetical protein KAR91_04705 [Candidatus Pacearchaeota archaeon]|nr:hypothetical protein [Candidatus Pacearchaeota archaeon]